MNLDRVHLSDVVDKISSGKVLKRKREREVILNGDLVYKVWVQNWTQGDITKHAIDTGFYCKENASALTALIYDESGERGYITKAGIPMGQSWKEFNSNTEFSQRKEFMACLLDKGVKCSGLYADLFPTNIIKVDGKISLIDLDSFNSYSFIFDKKREWYEKFELDAWWKPHESISRDLDKFYREYFHQCLGVEFLEKIDSPSKILDLKNICDNIEPG